MKPMKFTHLFIALFVLCLSNFAFAQNQDCKNITIESIDILPSKINVVGGNLVITDNADIEFILNIDFKDSKGPSDDISANVTFNGFSKSGRRIGNGLDYTYSRVGRIRRITGIKASQDDPITITSVVATISRQCNNDTIKVSKPFVAFRKLTSGAITSVLASDDYFVEKRQNHVFMNETVSAAIFAIVIGLNNSKKENPTPLELAMTEGSVKGIGRYVWIEGHDQRSTRLVSPTTDANGNWTFKDNMPIKDPKNPPVLVSFELVFVSLFKDSLTLTSVFKQKLGDNNTWDYKVRMDNVIGSDNPIFQDANGGMGNVLGLTLPSSSVTITGGSIVIADHSKFDMGLSSTNVGNGGINYKKINDVFINIQFKSESDRVFYHWGSVVSTSNPRIAINTDSLKIKDYTIINAEIRVVNDKKDTIVYESNEKFATSLDGKTTFLLLEKSEKIKLIKEAYAFGKSSLKVTDMKTLSALTFNFSLKKGSSIPASMTVQVEINTCKTDPEFIAVKLKYDPISGLWTGGQSILQTAECPITVKGFKINITNTCGFTYTAKNGYFDETKNTWVCEDECLKVNTDTFCGSTDHF